MLKHRWEMVLVMLFYFCFTSSVSVFAQQPPSTLVFAEQQESLLPSQESDASAGSQGVSSQQTDASAQKTKEEPKVLVAGSFAVSTEAAVEPVSQAGQKASSADPQTQNAVAPAENVSVSAAINEPQQAVQAVSSQAGSSKALPKDETVSEIKKVAVSEPEDSVAQWVWGEVVSVDPEKKQLTVKYLDYETYDEALMGLSIDTGTVFDNVKGLSEINVSDYVTVDYKKKEDNSNLATLIVVEKKDALVDKKQASVLVEEKKAVISAGGKAELDKTIVVSEASSADTQPVLNEVLEADALDSLDDITIPLAPPDTQPDIQPSEPVPVEDIDVSNQ